MTLELLALVLVLDTCLIVRLWTVSDQVTHFLLARELASMRSPLETSLAEQVKWLGEIARLEHVESTMEVLES